MRRGERAEPWAVIEDFFEGQDREIGIRTLRSCCTAAPIVQNNIEGVRLQYQCNDGPDDCAPCSKRHNYSGQPNISLVPALC